MTVLRETILLSAVSKTIAIKGPSWKRQFVRNQKQQTLKDIRRMAVTSTAYERLSWDNSHYKEKNGWFLGIFWRKTFTVAMNTWRTFLRIWTTRERRRTAAYDWQSSEYQSVRKQNLLERQEQQLIRDNYTVYSIQYS